MMADVFFSLARNSTRQKKQQESAKYYIQAMRIMGIYAADFGFDIAKTAEALINLGFYYTKKDQPHGFACNKLAMTLINKYPELKKHYKKFYLKLLEKAADFVDTITMDDAEYVAVVEFEYRSQTYVLFCRDDNVFDYLFRKIEYGEDGNEYYTSLFSHEEFEDVSAYFESICDDL
ncbi:MAG: DUF1292 domain-containing protein [Oscillospiraceae bacterium]|nr:DUF1292 domain-containing protein [Oscillospiraceae bacterium]